ncbi:MAG TPA: TetR/AcrR family transcriptional regulator [Aliidongia sp.]|uniref:TetR/AcrR family transcriptional regulator n=1 Tax=Aliidongia sp. TaxID=1914230 RepID=UPI002DDCA628|nr:TetR/AcrR family transcriptional regulator [Aliidongia sp.]HEV2678337.1 TetR/AcrR family transcriptional regulator [Aliidongia sp.]
MATRSYDSPKRTAAAAEKRARVVEAAGRLLSEPADVTAFSLDAVAKAAGVTRLTVYNQFGSRRGLLEVVFDERARQQGLGRLADALALADPQAALDRVIEIFCDFWGDDPAIGRLHGAIALDAEFAQAVAARYERRRQLMGTLVERIVPGAAREAGDLLFALTSYAMYELLLPGRSKPAVCALVKMACAAVLARFPRA